MKELLKFIKPSCSIELFFLIFFTICAMLIVITDTQNTGAIVLTTILFNLYLFIMYLNYELGYKSLNPNNHEEYQET